MKHPFDGEATAPESAAWVGKRSALAGDRDVAVADHGGDGERRSYAPELEKRDMGTERGEHRFALRGPGKPTQEGEKKGKNVRL